MREQIWGLFQGKALGADGVACFGKIGRLSADGVAITWSDGVMTTHRIKVKHALFNEIATSDDGALEGGLLLRIDQTNIPPGGSMRLAPSVRFHVSIVVAAPALIGCNSNQEANLSPRTTTGVVAGPGYNPYNPISYSQNNTGNRSGGR